MIRFIVFTILVSQIFIFINAWQVTVDFDFTIQNVTINKSEVKVFESVYSDNDYFALLSQTQNNQIDLNSGFMMIGARNYLYQLSLPNLTLLSSKSWPSSQFDSMQCLNRSIINNKDECDNYVKLYQKINKDTFRICSTNALNPKCRFYQLNMNESNLEYSVVLNETSGLGYSPLRAYENKYIYNYIESSKYLYTANTIDLNRYFTSINKEIDQDRISTNMFDNNNWLHRADFVNSFNTDERIFFVFNEDATNDESSPTSNRPIRRVPSISQICLNDQGAALNSLRNIWTTYLKTRLSCVYDTAKSVHDESSFKFEPTFQSSTLFYFDELKSMSPLFTINDRETNKNITYFYGVFTTSKYSITASAVCMFTMDQIMSAFHGDYKSKSTTSEQIKTNSIPKPRPSECPSKLTYQHLIFSRKNFVMENEILSEALIVETASQSRFLSIDTDFNVKKNNDVLFIGTDNGRVLTFVIETIFQNSTKMNQTEQSSKLIYSEELVVFNEEKRLQFESESTNRNVSFYKNVNIKRSPVNKTDKESILNLKLFNQNKTNYRLILTTQNRVISLPAHYCQLKTDFQKCNNLLYPYCIWSSKHSKCLDNNQENLNDMFIKNISNISDDLLMVNQIEPINKTNESMIIKQLINNLTATSQSMQISSPSDMLHSFLDINNTKITISMNLILFVLSLICFLVLSFLIGVLTAYFIYKKVFNSKQKLASIFNKLAKTTNKNDNLKVKISESSISVNDSKKAEIDCSQLYSTVKSKHKRESENFVNVMSVCSSSSSSFSPVEQSITKSTIVSIDNDPRYVYVNSKQANLSILDLIENPKTKFQDYDESEYFTIRKSKNKYQNSSDSSSSSSPNSAQTSSSTAKLVRANNNYESAGLNYLNRTLPTISVQMKQDTMERNTNTFSKNNKKYYI